MELKDTLSSKENEMAREIAIFICLPDSYVDIFKIFEKLMGRYWADCPFNIYIATETYAEKNQHNYIYVKCGEGSPQGERLLKGLSAVKERYVINLDCDLFLREPADTGRIVGYVDLMKQHGIKYISLLNRHQRIRRRHPHLNNDLYYVNKKQRYGISFGADIWDREYILSVFGGKPIDGWQIEEHFLKIVHDSEKGYFDDFLFTINSPLKFIHAVDKGKWLRKAYRETLKLGITEEEMSHRAKVSIGRSLRSEIRLVDLMPNGVIYFAKKVLSKLGRKFPNMY